MYVLIIKQNSLSHQMRSAVKNVAKYFPTAIITGRSRDKVYICIFKSNFFLF